MSTKKEKPCCDRCREVSSISGSFNCVGTCQCHQSESIEWEEKSVAALRGIGVEDNIPAIIKLISIVREEAITTAVAKAEKEGDERLRTFLRSEEKLRTVVVLEERRRMVEEIKACPSLSNDQVNDVLSLLKH